MPENQLSAIVARVRIYLARPEGARKVWDLMFRDDASIDEDKRLERAIGEIVLWEMQNCHNGRLREVDTEDIATVTERVIAAEWTMEAVA